MRTSRFTDEQIIGIVREYEAEAKLTELCRRQTGMVKITYDLLLLRAFSRVRPPEEAAMDGAGTVRTGQVR